MPRYNNLKFYILKLLKGKLPQCSHRNYIFVEQKRRHTWNKLLKVIIMVNQVGSRDWQGTGKVCQCVANVLFFHPHVVTWVCSVYDNLTSFTFMFSILYIYYSLIKTLKNKGRKKLLKNSKESEELDGKQRRSITCIIGIFKEENQSKNKGKSTKNYNLRKCPWVAKLIEMTHWMGISCSWENKSRISNTETYSQKINKS